MSPRQVRSVNKVLTEEERVRHQTIREQVGQEKAELIARGQRAKGRHIMLREAIGVLQETKAEETSIMSTVTLEEAQAKLRELIDKLAPGEEVIITRNEQPVAKLIGQQRSMRKPRRPGSAKGKLIILTEGKEHLEDFKEYMP